ncbi:endonuclease Q family protein [Candidatus Woesearchaeota archaeon]|nr:endonuclease Q family protein [Candidatus Woesearchaeota archaeon]
MKIISDLHLHSKYSRATSKQLDIANLEKWAKVKGLNLLGTSDFTHPKWIKELKANLQEQENGILTSKGGMNFILQTEVSLIYTDMGKGRRVHNVILAPNFDIVDQITEYFLKHGRIDYDGRPIFKIPCDELTESLMKISKDIEIIPAHIWTPWFALLGSMSGYNSVEEAFKDQTKNIHALETGLSSDPPMNWRLSKLDPFALVSFSDSHSFWPWRIGREATLFELKELTYNNLINALRTKEGLTGTIEVDPAYGKYHEDGHRNCNVCLTPKESKKLNNICPKCGKPLTIGVHHRVEELADRPEGFKPKSAKDFKRLIPLSEILSKLLGSGIATKKVWLEFNKLIDHFKSELNILLDASEEELKKVTDEKIVEKIMLNRQGKIQIQPGYDGEYGYPIFSEQDKKELPKVEIKKKQTGLNEFM